ncbi:hypothetical protein B5S28_g830 [[Candida] boidinii]|nr:hypothetical protein B5S28_g830 [[Candida] boidinii]OWB61185.1 hypothetical protein B5S29_g2070 [[Candida] boidinii]OWB71750.1 hypothetical protein B5S31_g1443 [[Candida] boidinii]OWB78357.1 hypothetical protein B5S32_g2549 [[Candida] boidinii]
MSRIFLNSTFKLYKLEYLPDTEASATTESSLIDSFCDDDEFSNQHLDTLSKLISNCILVNGFYKKETGSLLPSRNPVSSSSSILFDDTNKNSTATFQYILSNLAIRIKSSELEVDGRKFKIGHFRFKYLKSLPIQIFILLEIRPGLILLFSKSLPKLNQLLIDYFVNELGCIIETINLSNDFLHKVFNDSIKNLVSYTKGNHSDLEKIHLIRSLGDLELSFLNIKTINNNLNSIILNIKNKDILLFLKTLENSQQRAEINEDEDEVKKLDIVSQIYSYLIENTSIDFNTLKLSRLKTDLFLISSDGKLKFTDTMTYLPFSSLTSHDKCLSIWDIILNLCDLCELDL